MVEATLLDRFFDFIADHAFSVFLWARGITAEQFRDYIYVDECEYRGHLPRMRVKL